MAATFKDDFFENLGELFTNATKEGTPFVTTRDYISSQFNQLSLTQEQIADVTATYLANITNNLINNSFRTALELTDKAGKYSIEVGNLTKQGSLLDAQIGSTNADKDYKVAQKEKMIEQVEHNKTIKAMDSMGNMIGILGSGGLAVSPSIFEVFFALNKSLTTIEIVGTASVSKL